MTKRTPSRELSAYQRAAIAAYSEQQLRYYSDQAFSPTVRKACAEELLRRTGEARS